MIRIPAGKRIMGVFARGNTNKDTYRDIYRGYFHKSMHIVLC